MLGAIAKKPLSITELIQTSDASVIIKMIDKNDDNQKTWFRALFTTQVVKNKEALNCIQRWAHLCSEDDVTLLLNLSIQTNTDELHQLVIKCATCLDLEQLMLVLTRHFYRNKFSHVLNSNIGPSLTIIFNKLNDKKLLMDDLVKEILLLLLQNPVEVFTYITNECVKNKFYTDCLIETFDKIKEIAKIDHVGIASVKEVLDKYGINSQNRGNYAYLFKKMHEIDYFTTEDIMLRILLPCIKKWYEGECLNELSNILQTLIVSIIETHF